MGIPDAIETVSLREYYYVAFGMTMLLWLAELFLWNIISVKFHLRSHIGIDLVLLFGASWQFSSFVTESIFKVLGSRLRGPSVQTWSRALAEPEGFVTNDEAVEFHIERSKVRTHFLGFVTFCLGAVLFMYFAGEQSTILALAAAAVVFSFAWCAIQQLLAWDGCVLRADSQGILGRPARHALRRKRLPWSEIASCDIVTRYDLVQREFLIEPVLKDEFGRVLMSLDLEGVPTEPKASLLKFIKAKLPKPRVDFAEL